MGFRFKPSSTSSRKNRWSQDGRGRISRYRWGKNRTKRRQTRFAKRVETKRIKARIFEEFLSFSPYLLLTVPAVREAFLFATSFAPIGPKTRMYHGFRFQTFLNFFAKESLIQNGRIDGVKIARIGDKRDSRNAYRNEDFRVESGNYIPVRFDST